jgi:DNA-binding SARP family transcriptional activator/TolB-like protein/tetratricopeptide (TPR) repeat protein
MTLRTMHLRLLGRFGVIALDGEPRPIQLPTRKTGALLAYLGMSRDYAAGREELAALLWGDCSDQQARQSLRQALVLLRKELGPAQLCTADAKVVRLDPSQWSIDARDFETLARSRNAEDLSRAARSFAGDFLSGFNIDEEAFEEWVNGQRTRLQLAAAQLCETFVKQPDLVIDADQALAAVEQLMALDPLREDWQRHAIALYARYRGKNEALARAHVFAGLLQRELGVTPERETRAMLESIKASAAAPPVAIRPDGSDSARDTSPVDAIADTPDASPEPAASGFAAWRPKLLGQRSGLKIFATAAIAVLVLAAGVLDRSPFRSIAGPSASPTSPVLSPRSDPWRSPSSANEAQLPKGTIPIVVLPFMGLGGTDDSIQLTADMLTDDLTIRLSRVPSFRVISRQTARSFQVQTLDVTKLGDELHVRYVLEGSVRLQDDRLRVNVELIDPATRLSVWSGRVERDGGDRQGVRDEIVARLARELHFEVLPIESLRLSRDADADALAYRGWAALSQVRLDGYNKALPLFNKALERDPENLSAQIGTGAYHARMGAQVLDTDSADHRIKAQEILRRVLNRDPNSSQAHFFLALALNQLPTLPEALEHLEYAIKIDPSDASAHAQIGNGLIRSGRPAEGRDRVHYAMLLSPRDPAMPVWLEFAGNAELELNNYSEAAATFQRSIALNPGYPRSWAGLVAAHALAGRQEEARRLAEKLKTFAPDLNEDALTSHFGRHEGSRVREGLRLALALSAAH